MRKNTEKSSFFQKINFFWERKKKCYFLSFPILGILDSTRALQSSPFQNTGGGGGLSVMDREEVLTDGRTEILVSNIGFLDDLITNRSKNGMKHGAYPVFNMWRN